MEYPSSDKPETIDSFDVSTEPAFLSPNLDERLRNEEASLRQISEGLEHRRLEADQIHRAYDEKQRLADLEANRQKAEQQTQQRNEKEQKLLAEIGALRNARVEQRQRIEEANATSRERSAAENWIEAEVEPAGSNQVEAADVQFAQFEPIQVAPVVETESLATDRQLLNAKIKTLGQAATEQIDRMEEAKGRLALLEQIRRHAETMVCQRAEREIRLQAEIEALHQTEAAQLERIEAAEVEAQQFAKEQTRFREAAEARRHEEADVRHRAAIQQLEDEARRRTEDEEQKLAHLETIRAKAEAAAQERSDREESLNSQLLAFGEAAAEQLKRIENLEADLAEAEQSLQQLEGKARQSDDLAAIRRAETETRRQAIEAEFDKVESEARALTDIAEQHLVELESARNQAEVRLHLRQAEEQRLVAELEALNQAAAEQLRRIETLEADLAEAEQSLQQLEVKARQSDELATIRRAETETRRQAIEAEFDQAESEARALTNIAELQAPEDAFSLDKADPQTKRVTDSGEDAEGFTDHSETETSNVASTAGWSIADPGDQTKFETEGPLELVSDQMLVSPIADVAETAISETLANDLSESVDSVLIEDSVQAASEESPMAVSLADRFRTNDPEARANAFQELTRLDESRAFDVITSLFDDGSEAVRNAAARALYDLSQARAETFTRALREAPPERRRLITMALDGSGIAAEAIESLAGESREKTHEAFSLLFLMAKAGEFQSLFQAIEKHPKSAVRLSVIKLLTFSNRPDVIPALRSLAVRGALPIEVRSALMESIYEISSNARVRAQTAA